MLERERARELGEPALAGPRRGRDLVFMFLHLMVGPTRALARLPRGFVA